MRSPVRHAALLFAATLAASGAAVALVGGAGDPISTGSSPAPNAEREANLATPAPGPLCAQTASPPRHRSEFPGEPSSSAPSAPTQAVPILAYHYVRTDPDPTDVLGQRLSVTPRDFAAQMDLLHRSGAHAVSLADLLAAMRGDVLLPPHPVVLSFDDGHADFLENALPVLQRDHLCATVFAVPDFLGKPSYLTVHQLETLAATGVRIGAHTMDHLDLNTQPPPVVADQVVRSADVLRALTGQPVRDFAYPYGSFDATAVAAVQAAGFDDAVALAAQLPESWAGRFTLPRVEVIGGESLQAFAADAGIPFPAR